MKIKTIITFLAPLIPFICALSMYYGLLYFYYHKKKIIIPSCVGKNITDIFDWISHNNINIKILEYSHNNAQPHGLIIAQYPSPATTINKHMSFSLLINIHKKSGIPNIIGLSLQEASKALDLAGYTYSCKPIESFYPESTIVACTDANSQKHIIIFVSKTEPKNPLNIMIPDFTGLSCNEINNISMFKSIECYSSHNTHIKSSHNDIIKKQQPLAGTICKPDETIIILWH